MDLAAGITNTFFIEEVILRQYIGKLIKYILFLCFQMVNADYIEYPSLGPTSFKIIKGKAEVF